ncbi:hypothetical protein J1N35_043089 [Gossypium stocksii]|uniref:Uncharacterized protein n=1 Tax=Gossypium stocksii TaxID=47602 RepID=A0A9D3U6T0_9ROSI|nr:hypothetical protein J1N35_043089 [Gossypium stocksii]
MLLTLENRVINLEESVEDVKDTLKVVEGRIDELDSMREQLKEFVMESLSYNVKAMQGMLNSTADKLTVRDDALKATMTTLKKHIEELLLWLCYGGVVGPQIRDEVEALGEVGVTLTRHH